MSCHFKPMRKVQGPNKHVLFAIKKIFIDHRMTLKCPKMQIYRIVRQTFPSLRKPTTLQLVDLFSLVDKKL